MLKLVGAVRNLACDYSYYLKKSSYTKTTPKHVMSEELLEKLLKNTEFANHAAGKFTWHGGETLMRPCPSTKGHGTAKKICSRTHHRQ